MPQPQNSSRSFAVCIDNREYPVSLELHKLYRVVPDEDAARDGDLRIVDESGEDYLYPARNFVVMKLANDLELALQRSFSQQLAKTA